MTPVSAKKSPSTRVLHGFPRFGFKGSPCKDQHTSGTHMICTEVFRLFRGSGGVPCNACDLGLMAEAWDLRRRMWACRGPDLWETLA